VTVNQTRSRRRKARLDMNLSVPAHAALDRRTCLASKASQAVVVNSILSRYADIMAKYHAKIESKFNPTEIEAMRRMISSGKYITVKKLWLQDRATSKLDFAAAVRCASADPDWMLSNAQTNTLLKILAKKEFSTEEYFGLIDYLSLETVL